MRTARSLRLTVLLPLILSVFGTACGEADIVPREGGWDFMGSAAVDDTCNFDQLAIDNPGTFTLTNNGDSTFTVNDTDNMFDCTIEGSDFTCPSRLAGEDDIGAQYNLDAVVSYNVVATGMFSSQTEMSGRQEIVIDCAGDDCGTFEMLAMVTTPCGWAQDFTATAK
jgi:hypothetical protein